MANKVALVTGASSGIGKELTKLLAQDKYFLILVARDKLGLEKVAEDCKRQHNANSLIIPADLAKPGAAQEIFDKVSQKHLIIDVLINNAGFGTHGFFADLDKNTELEEIQVNIIALTELTRLFLPQMLEKKSGKILQVASIASYFPGPHMAVYYATKNYVRAFSIALAVELKGCGVSVSCLCPGPTITGFADRANVNKLQLFNKTAVSAEEVALAGYKGLMKGSKVIIPGFTNKTTAFLSKLISSPFTAKIVKKIQ